ncbi:MAG: hypothetical protein JSU05_02235 [Bacteroidetes bacterium]|jgi:hypothetical protein|nr:hypothetical protein [Bacteroidota bacterium]
MKTIFVILFFLAVVIMIGSAWFLLEELNRNQGMPLALLALSGIIASITMAVYSYTKFNKIS